MNEEERIKISDELNECCDEVKFCPLCGAKEEELTGGTEYDSIFKRDRYDYYCNNCGKSFIVLRI